MNAMALRRYIERYSRITANDIPDIAAAMRKIVMQNIQDKQMQTIMILALLDNGRIYGIAEGNNFKVDSPIPPQLTGYKTVCCVGAFGSDGGQGCELSDKYYARTKDIRQTFSKVFSDMSNNGIGGSHVDLYQLDIRKQTISRYSVPITESGIEYVSAMATLGAGSYIDWGRVNSDPVATNADATANTAVNMASSANTAATNAANNIKKLVDGSYSGGTFIDGKNVVAPYITGGKIVGTEIIGGTIRGGRYYNSDTDGYAYLDVGNKQYGDFNFYGNNGARNVFRIYDAIDYSSFYGQGVKFLDVGHSTARPQGAWNFSDATVTGLTAVFA